MSNENIELQKEGGLAPYHDQQFETGLINSVPRPEMASLLDALADSVKDIKDPAEIVSTIRKFAQTIRNSTTLQRREDSLDD